MKKLIIFIAIFATTVAFAKTSYVFTEATDLTIVGKLMPGKTVNPYHRVDTTTYKGFTKRENQLVRMSSGMACAFKTNSKAIQIHAEFGYMDNSTNITPISSRGFDLYIKKDGKWLWAGEAVHKLKKLDKDLIIVADMDGTEHECLLYFPTYSELYSVKIGVIEGATLEPLQNPFRSRVAIWGSSFTHGASTTRSGMTYPAQFSRMTGIQMLSLGCSGRCMLQDYFCDVLCDVDAEAFVFDAFSNPKADVIEERLVPFIDRMIKAHPGKPLIFQQTIYRQNRNFNLKIEKKEAAKMETAARIMDALHKGKDADKYKDVYFIIPDACGDTFEATVDGVHPSDYGYTLWARSIEQPLMKIFAKYGIK